jgi:hypothetical protein
MMTMPSASEDPTLVATRRSLHALAARVIAPLRVQATGNEIALTVRPGGFGTPELPEGGWVGVDGTDLVRVDADGARETARITSLLEAADFVGLDDASSDLTDERLEVHAGAVAILAEVWETGDVALRALDPSATPILWPEHFDIAIELDQATYGVSPGDDDHPEPYAYISLWSPPTDLVTGPDHFWNAVGFTGAERPWTNDASAMTDFFRAGRDGR